MIITEKKSIESITESLTESLGDARKVYLFGCGSCADQCATGGALQVSEMTEALREKGFDVTGSSLIDETCYNQLVRKEFRLKGEIKEADAVLVLSCGAGVKTVADNAEPSQPVLPALNSMFLATVERQGRFFEGCSLCGECVLDKTAGICPHTECAKGMLNGPCGGVVGGKCEVNLDHDCAWVRIYARLKEQDRLHLLTDISPPKDHSATTQPRQILLR